jgi:hypothetical protein
MSLSIEIDEFIASLPSEYQAVAAGLREYLKAATTEQIKSIFASLLTGDVMAAYDLIVPNLSAQETAAEIDNVATSLTALNADNAEHISQFRQMLITMLSMLVQTGAALL